MDLFPGLTGWALPQSLLQSVRCNRPVRGSPNGVAAFDNDGLGRLVTHTEPGSNLAGYRPIFDDHDYSTWNVVRGFREALKLLVGCGADRTLRAMLENEDGMRSRHLEQLLKIFVLT